MNIGLLERDRGNLTVARRELETAHTIRTRLSEVAHDLELGRDIAMGNFNLATVAIYSEDTAVAEEYLHTAVKQFEKLLEDNPQTLRVKHELAACYRLLADVESADGRAGQAIALYQLAKEQTEALVLASPEVAGYKASLSGIFMNLGASSSRARARRRRVGFLGSSAPDTRTTGS